MKISIINLSDKKINSYAPLIKEAIRDFPELSNLYEEIKVFISNEDKIKEGVVSRKEKDFLGVLEPTVSLIEEMYSISSSGLAPKGCIKINLDRFRLFPKWKRRFSVRHECCHLLKTPSISSRTLDRLLQRYPLVYLRNIIKYRREYVAHICMLKRYPEDWLREPLRIPENIESPRRFYRRLRKLKGLKAVVEAAISNSINLLRLIYLYEYVIENVKATPKLKQDLQRYKMYLRSWWLQVEKDTHNKLPKIHEWITQEDFKNEERFFQQVYGLLKLLEETFQVKSVQMPRQKTMEVHISHVAIGGVNSWRSDSMKKIQAAPKMDVTTVLNCDLPFSLSRLPNGIYKMKCNNHVIRFLVQNIKRPITVTKHLTGWEPSGDVELIGDRFGRFSYCQLEIQIPYRIDEKMFDYLCPRCGVEVEEHTKECPVCHKTFTSQESRRPPRREPKVKAIELINSFLDAYRFVFKDYFIEHLRYQDIMNYGIKYLMRDGTKAKWSESLDTNEYLVTGGTLIADDSALRAFKKLLLEKTEERIRLSDQFLSSAKNRISTEEYRLAILEAIMALEIEISDYILSDGHDVGIQNPKAYNRKVGLLPRVKKVWEILQDKVEQLNDFVFSGCKWAIKKRNKIVHEGLTNISCSDAQKAIWNVNEMVGYIRRITSGNRSGE